MSAAVYIAAARLLDRLVIELAQTRAGEPAVSVIHPGSTVPDYGCQFDGDLEGAASVRIVDITPSPRHQRSADIVDASVTIDMLVTRCYATPEDNGMPTLGTLDSATRDALDDADAMFRAARETFTAVTIGAWRPRSAQGGIHGGSMQITVPVDAYCPPGVQPAPIDRVVLPTDGDPRF